MDLYCLIWAEPPVQFPFANLNSKAMNPCIYAFVKDANSIAQWSLPPSLCSLFLCHLSFSLCLSHTHSLYPIEMNDSIFALNDKIRLNKYWLLCFFRFSYQHNSTFLKQLGLQTRLQYKRVGNSLSLVLNVI